MKKLKEMKRWVFFLTLIITIGAINKTIESQPLPEEVIFQQNFYLAPTTTLKQAEAKAEVFRLKNQKLLQAISQKDRLLTAKEVQQINAARLWALKWNRENNHRRSTPYSRSMPKLRPADIQREIAKKRATAIVSRVEEIRSLYLKKLQWQRNAIQGSSAKIEEKRKRLIALHKKQRAINIGTDFGFILVPEEQKVLATTVPRGLRAIETFKRAKLMIAAVIICSFLAFVLLLMAANENPFRYFWSNSSDLFKLCIPVWGFFGIFTWELNRRERHSQRKKNAVSTHASTGHAKTAEELDEQFDKAIDLAWEKTMKIIGMVVPSTLVFLIGILGSPTKAIAQKAPIKSSSSKSGSKKKNKESSEGAGWGGAIVALGNISQDKAPSMVFRTMTQVMYKVAKDWKIGPSALVLPIFETDEASASGIITGIGFKAQYKKWLDFRTFLRWKNFTKATSKDDSAWSSSVDIETIITLTPKWSWGRGWMTNYIWIAPSDAGTRISGLHMWRYHILPFWKSVSIGIHAEWSHMAATKEKMFRFGGWVGIKNYGITVSRELFSKATTFTLEAVIPF